MVKKWTTEEEVKLKENYPLMGYRVLELFPERSKASVLRKASWMGLKILRKERKKLREDKVGYLDIECSQLQADFGIIYTWVIKEQGKNKYYHAEITREEILDGILDKRICQELVDTLKQFTLVLTYYGTFFDLTFIRTRCLMNKVAFIPLGELEHKDVYFLAKRTLRLHSYRLESVCDALGIVGKTHLDGHYWILANSGNPDAIKYILDHNMGDVQILEKVHEILSQFSASATRWV